MTRIWFRPDGALLKTVFLHFNNGCNTKTARKQCKQHPSNCLPPNHYQINAGDAGKNISDASRNILRKLKYYSFRLFKHILIQFFSCRNEFDGYVLDTMNGVDTTLDIMSTTNNFSLFTFADLSIKLLVELTGNMANSVAMSSISDILDRSNLCNIVLSNTFHN